MYVHILCYIIQIIYVIYIYYIVYAVYNYYIVYVLSEIFKYIYYKIYMLYVLCCMYYIYIWCRHALFFKSQGPEGISPCQVGFKVKWYHARGNRCWNRTSVERKTLTKAAPHTLTPDGRGGEMEEAEQWESWDTDGPTKSNISWLYQSTTSRGNDAATPCFQITRARRHKSCQVGFKVKWHHARGNRCWNRTSVERKNTDKGSTIHTCP